MNRILITVVMVAVTSVSAGYAETASRTSEGSVVLNSINFERFSDTLPTEILMYGSIGNPASIGEEMHELVGKFSGEENLPPILNSFLIQAKTFWNIFSIRIFKEALSLDQMMSKMSIDGERRIQFYADIMESGSSPVNVVVMIPLDEPANNFEMLAKLQNTAPAVNSRHGQPYYIFKAPDKGGHLFSSYGKDYLVFSFSLDSLSGWLENEVSGEETLTELESFQAFGNSVEGSDVSLFLNTIPLKKLTEQISESFSFPTSQFEQILEQMEAQLSEQHHLNRYRKEIHDIKEALRVTVPQLVPGLLHQYSYILQRFQGICFGFDIESDHVQSRMAVIIDEYEEPPRALDSEETIKFFSQLPKADMIGATSNTIKWERYKKYLIDTAEAQMLEILKEKEISAPIVEKSAAFLRHLLAEPIDPELKIKGSLTWVDFEELAAAVSSDDMQDSPEVLSSADFFGGDKKWKFKDHLEKRIAYQETSDKMLKSLFFPSGKEKAGPGYDFIRYKAEDLSSERIEGHKVNGASYIHTITADDIFGYQNVKLDLETRLWYSSINDLTYVRAGQKPDVMKTPLKNTKTALFESKTFIKDMIAPENSSLHRFTYIDMCRLGLGFLKTAPVLESAFYEKYSIFAEKLHAAAASYKNEHGEYPDSIDALEDAAWLYDNAPALLNEVFIYKPDGDVYSKIYGFHKNRRPRISPLVWSFFENYETEGKNGGLVWTVHSAPEGIKIVSNLSLTNLQGMFRHALSTYNKKPELMENLFSGIMQLANEAAVSESDLIKIDF